MRSLLIPITLFASTTAHAGAAPAHPAAASRAPIPRAAPRPAALRPIEVGALPPSCVALAHVPADARIATPALAAHVSVASCAAEQRMNALGLAHDDASMRALAIAVAPSLAMLDDVAAAGGPAWQLTAQFTRGDLYRGMVVRMRAATHGDASLEPELKPWLDAARAAFGEVVAIAQAHPDLATTNAVIASDIAASARALAPR